MNVRMWQHAATRRNVARLREDGIAFVGPNEGEMACGEYGPGRMAEPGEIIDAIEMLLGAKAAGPLAGRRVLITSGPTQEPIDPVRYIANRSSGKQGHALARAARALGAEVTLVSGPVSLPDPEGVRVIKVETAHEMMAATLEALPADIAICAAAVADWRAADEATHKLKKPVQGGETVLKLAQNPDILATIAGLGQKRPRLVIGFRRRDRKSHCQRHRQAPRQGGRLDRRQRCVARDRRHGRRPDASPSDHAGRRRGLAADEQGRDGGKAARPRERGATGSALGG